MLKIVVIKPDNSVEIKDDTPENRRLTVNNNQNEYLISLPTARLGTPKESLADIDIAFWGQAQDSFEDINNQPLNAIMTCYASGPVVGSAYILKDSVDSLGIEEGLKENEASDLKEMIEAWARAHRNTIQSINELDISTFGNQELES